MRTSGSNLNMLTEAVERNTVLVLSLPSAGMFRHHKSRFLADRSEGLWIEAVSAEWPLLTSLRESREPVGVSFKAGGQRADFVAPVLDLDPSYRLNADVPVAAALIERPGAVRAVQRRHHFRAAVHAADNLRVRLWRIGDRDPLTTTPSPAREFQAVAHDVSVGGIGVLIDWTDPNRAPFRDTDRFRVEIIFANSDPFVVEARPGKPRLSKSPGQYELGLEFKKLEDDLAGRQVLGELERIVNSLELLQVRRSRGS